LRKKLRYQKVNSLLPLTVYAWLLEVKQYIT